jgi:hypothetical protein
MGDTSESNVKTINLCHSCCNKMERKVGSMKFRRADELDNHYPGTLSPTEYFWCEYCKKAYMSPEQCAKDVTQEQARNGQLVFVLAPLQTPPVKVAVVDWLRE